MTSSGAGFCAALISRSYNSGTTVIRKTVSVFLNSESQDTLKSHMVRGTVGTFAFKVVNTILVFGANLLLARLLGAKEYGVYAYAISWASLISVLAVMGLNTLLVREVARYKALEDWGSLRGILRWSDRFVLVTSTGFATLFALIVWILQGKFAPEVRQALWLAMALVPLLSFLLLWQGGLQGLGYVVEAQVPYFIILPGTFLVLTLVFYSVMSLNGATSVGLRILAGLTAVSVALFLLQRCSPKSVTDVLPIYRQREWLKSVLPLLFVGAAGIINQRISTVMVGGMLGPHAAGIFDIALQASTLIKFTLMAVNMPLAPTVAELYAKGEKERLQRVVTKSARVALLGSLPIALGLIFTGHWVLAIFGKEFVGGRIVLAILSAGQLANVGMGSVLLLLNMTGHERDSAKGIGFATLINILLNAVLIPVWSIKGAAIAYSLSIMTWNTLFAIWVPKKLGIFPTALGDICQRRAP